MRKYKKSTIEVENVFLDGLVKKHSNDFELKDKKIESPIKIRIFQLILIAGIFTFFFLLAYSFKESILEHKKYDQLWLANRFINQKIKSERGIIYSRGMVPLVKNIDSFSLYFNPSAFSENDRAEEEKIIKEVSEIIGTTPDSLKEKINEQEKKERFILLKNNLNREELVWLEVKKDELKGITIKKETRRRYLEGSEFSHIIGYLGKISKEELESKGKNDYSLNDYIGKVGIEKEYENYLAEKKGILEIERNVKGKIISKKIKETPASGDNLVLSIDAGLEKKSAEAINRFLNNGIGTGGAVVALDPRNGDVLALVSLPTFDNNLFAKGITSAELEKINSEKGNPQFNRVIRGLYPTGSVIKPLISIAALDEKVITPETNLFCPKELCLKNKYSGKLKCFADWKFHGWATVRRAIAESINPFFYMVGGGYERPAGADPRLPKRFKGLGVERIKKWLDKFGWDKKTGIDLPGEITGRIPDPEWKKEHFKTPAQKEWHIGDTYNLSIGQGYIMITPIEIATAFQAIANGGIIYQPRLVKEIISASGKKEEIKPKILNSHFFSNFADSIVREGMRMAVSPKAGTIPFLNNLPVKVAAKTGTAQTPKDEVYHNWVVAFAPYDDPEIVIVVLVENVKGEHIIAQKAAREILEWYFKNKH